MDTRTQQLADVILCIFETSSKLPKYSTVATLNDGPGGVKQITWGYHQGTDASNTVDEILEAFVDIPSNDADVLDAQKWALRILPEFRSNTPATMRRLASDNKVKVMLGVIGAMPEGQQAQRLVFRRKYMQPAIDACVGSGWVEPLSMVAVLDGMTHGSWGRIRDLVSPKLSEKHWIESYLLKRNKWLRLHPTQVLRNTACRSGALLRLVDEGNWGLTTPFMINMEPRRGKFTITEADLRVF